MDICNDPGKISAYWFGDVSNGGTVYVLVYAEQPQVPPIL